MHMALIYGVRHQVFICQASLKHKEVGKGCGRFITLDELGIQLEVALEEAPYTDGEYTEYGSDEESDEDKPMPRLQLHDGILRPRCPDCGIYCLVGALSTIDEVVALFFALFGSLVPQP